MIVRFLPRTSANFSADLRPTSSASSHKYIFSKLLVHFIEDTCLFLGYSLSDAHIQTLLFDACEATKRDKLENVFLLDYNDEPQTVKNDDTGFTLHKDRRSAQSILHRSQALVHL